MRLQVITAVAAWAVTSASQSLFTARNLWPRDADFKALSEKLSVNAKVYYPGSDEFNQASSRWSNLKPPTVNVVVVPGTENDVVETVKFANQKNLTFLAYNGAHGAITTLGQMKGLSGVNIAEDGKTVTVAGGTISKLLVHTLWDAGKQAVTGCCECVSYLGPALGGGHGWLQGRHGLVGDQFESINIVLANGTLATVDSNSDLWWALKGAGHNFGIVTSVTSKIFDVEYKDWAIEILTFSGSKVEELYDTVNKYLLKNGTQPTDVINWSYWNNKPDLDPSNPVIQILIIQEGVTAVDSVYTAPFQSLEPLSVEVHTGGYTDLAKWVGITTEDIPCQKNGAANPRFPIYLETFNVAAQKQAFEVFADAVRGDSIFNNSLVTFDGYSMEGVRAVDAESTAFAYRNQNVLVAPLFTYMPGDPVVEEKAANLGNQIRQILHEGSGRDYVPAYVNYAYGDEGPKEWYGSESWRQSRLQSLKTKYDPNGMFSFYAPIM
ncbi:FAD-linked oxidoreductase chyH [Cladobotryum mycophilum]|uniref:FAD-linked oxidoreductase chyH n=1 Tax=Cladobotryum mycophilum TaxID=491253 RepID=A0ABR0SQN1_9HYPO